MLGWIALTTLNPVAHAETATAAEVSTDVRQAYVAGEPILVRITVANPTSEPVAFADLASRPHLVRFDLVGEDGKKQTWFNTPPKQDTGERWDIVPRGQRKVLLEVPSSQRLAPGRYALTIRVLDESGEIALTETAIELTPADPVSGTLVHDGLAIERHGHQQVWVQRSLSGYDLYLHQASSRNVARVVGDYHLGTLEGPVTPVLSHARPADASRHVYWQDGDKALTWLRVEAAEAVAAPRTVTLPYPRIETLGRGATDGNGGLHIPLWIPGPRGGAGELRVASIGEQPRFRMVTRLGASPDWLATEVDAAGNLRMLLAVDGHVDLYTLASVGELPAVGKRLVKNVPAEDGTTRGDPLYADFGYLAGDAGGLSAFVLFRTEAGLVGEWLDLGGTSLAKLAPVALPEGAEIIDVLPLTRDDYVLLVRTQEGLLTALSPGELPVTVVKADTGGLLTNGDQILVRTLQAGGPYVLHPVR